MTNKPIPIHLVQIVSALLIISLLFSVAIFFQRANGLNRSSYLINITRGSSADRVVGLLKEREIIRGVYGFNLGMKLMGLEYQIKAGVYRFSPSMSYYQILTKLKRSQTIPPPLTSITFPEGKSIYKMAMLLKGEGLGDWESFKDLTQTDLSEFRKKFKFLAEVETGSLEGYLFPDTYLVSADISTSSLAQAMLKRFSEVVLPLWEESKGKTKYSLHEIITLASIIEKEAQVAEEQPIISSVFHNRLKIKMKLDADPTVKYVLGKKIMDLKELRIDSPYNTYRYRGLPPGPICSPGLSAIQAALNPAETDYLYFIARWNGTHAFSKTLKEHLRAKKRIGRL